MLIEVAQFVLFAFFILSEDDLLFSSVSRADCLDKAKGHAIATGFLFALTLIQKLVYVDYLTRG